jgi:4-hydroxy-tetrahydrodipicolinate synthase
VTSAPFAGVGVALITLFDDDLAVDVAATADLAVRIVDVGVGAVVVCGSTGEAAALEPVERVALVRAVRAALPADVLVIAGTGAASARQACAHTLAARDAGADAALALSPLNAQDPRAYYDAIAKAAPDLPLLAYHFPNASPPGIPLSVLADLPVVAMKDSTGDAERLLAELDTWDRPVYPGSSVMVAMARAVACPGVILALANAEPADCVAAFAGDAAAQRRLIRGHMTAKNFPHGIKALTASRFGTSVATRMG